MHLMSLHPSVGIMYFKPISRSRFRVFYAYPSIHVTLKITVVSYTTHQQLFKQKLAPWSVTSEVSTLHSRWSASDQATSAYAAKKEAQNLVVLSLVLSTVYFEDTVQGGEQFEMLRSSFPCFH